MKIKEGFILRNVAGSNVVVPVGQATVDFNGMMSLNDTGAFLFDKLTKGITEEQLIRDLMDEYSIDKELATKYVKDFIEKVESEGLFE